MSENQNNKKPLPPTFVKDLIEKPRQKYRSGFDYKTWIDNLVKKKQKVEEGGETTRPYIFQELDDISYEYQVPIQKFKGFLHDYLADRDSEVEESEPESLEEGEEEDEENNSGEE